MAPSKEEALHLAIMMNAGMPSLDALRYFFPDSTEIEVKEAHKAWMKSRELEKAILTVQGKPWQEMNLDERIRFAIDKHYSEMAYFLYSHNYAELVGGDKTKADTCRQALEAKLAGSAGKMNALDQWLDDVRSGRVTLAKQPSLPS
jgi:hypothetical protein